MSGGFVTEKESRLVLILCQFCTFEQIAPTHLIKILFNSNAKNYIALMFYSVIDIVWCMTSICREVVSLLSCWFFSSFRMLTLRHGGNETM